MFKLQSPSKHSPLMKCIYRDLLSTVQNSFWTRQFWCLLVLLLFFVSPLPHRKMFPFKDFFSFPETNKKCCLGRDQVNREGEVPCLVRNCRTPIPMAWGGTLLNHPSWNEQAHWKNLKKNSLKPNTASHNTGWYTDTDGLLEHSPSGGSLY